MLIQGPLGSSCVRLRILPPAPRASPNIGGPLEPLPPQLAPASAQRAAEPSEPGGGARAELRLLAQALVEAFDALARMSPCHTRPPQPPHLH